MLANERIGRYELVAHLAAGGMGQVYLARTGGLGGFERHVVIKTLDIEGHDADEDEATAMFLDEARVLGLLHHQHIAPVYEIDKDENRLYLVMDYVHGHTAYDVWTRTVSVGAALPIDFTLTVVAAAASGLHYAHTRRGPDGKRLHIVHRDVTLSNLMVGFDGAVKLIDFGIAKAANRSTKTQIGFVKGKVGYMAPEQLRGHAVDARSDVFALGIVLYELSTMRRAFREESDRATMERIKNGQLVQPSTFIPDYPRELERIVARALRVDPRERYPDADSMRRELEALGHGLGLVLGDAAVIEVMTQLFENRNEPWQPQRARRAETELDVSLEIVPAQDDQPKRPPPLPRAPLRAATQAADALIEELRVAPKPSNGVVAQLARRGGSFDTDGVTIAKLPNDGEDLSIPPVGKDTDPMHALPLIDSERVTVPGSIGKDSDGVMILPPPITVPPPIGKDTDGVLIVPGSTSAGGGVTIKGGSRKDFAAELPPPPPLPPPPNPSAHAKKVYTASPTMRVLPAGPRSRHRWGWAFAAVVFVIAIGAGVFVMLQSGGDGAAQASDASRPVAKTLDAAAVAPPKLTPALVDDKGSGSASAEPSIVVPPPPATVMVKITTTPADATVLLDGKRLGKTPFEGSVDAGPGLHVIKIRRRGYTTTRFDVELTADLTRDIALVRSKGEPAP